MSESTRSRNLRVFVTHTNRDHFSAKSSKQPFFKVAKMLLEDDLLLESQIEDLDPSPSALRERILKKITMCDYHIVLLTPTSLERDWVIFELGAGLGGLGRSEPKFPNDTVADRIVLVAESAAILSSVPEFCRNWKFFYWNPGKKKLRPLQKDGENRVWPGTFRTLDMQNKIGKLLLHHTFNGLNGHALGHSSQNPQGHFTKGEYEAWLQSFGAWSPRKVFAVSRQRLKYWLNEGKEYRVVLKENIDSGLDVSRLSLWSINADLVPTSWTYNEKKALWQAVGRTGKPNYECALCKTYDLLWLFLDQCHSTRDEAYYAFRTVIQSYHWAKQFSELLMYEDNFVLNARFRPGARVVRYSLFASRPRTPVNGVLAFVKHIENESLDKAPRTIRINGNTWTFPAWGKIRCLIETLEQFHKELNKKGVCNWKLIRP